MKGAIRYQYDVLVAFEQIKVTIPQSGGSILGWVEGVANLRQSETAASNVTVLKTGAEFYQNLTETLIKLC